MRARAGRSRPNAQRLLDYMRLRFVDEAYRKTSLDTLQTLALLRHGFATFLNLNQTKKKKSQRSKDAAEWRREGELIKLPVGTVSHVNCGAGVALASFCCLLFLPPPPPPLFLVLIIRN